MSNLFKSYSFALHTVLMPTLFFFLRLKFVADGKQLTTTFQTHQPVDTIYMDKDDIVVQYILIMWSVVV